MAKKKRRRKQARDSAANVSAQEFRLVDSSGALRGLLAVDCRGLPALVLYDRQRNERIGAYILGDGCPAVCLKDADEDERIILTLGNEGDSCMALYRGSEGARAALFVARDGKAVLDLWGREGGKTIGLSASEDGDLRVGLWDGDLPRIGFAVSTEGKPSTLVVDRDLQELLGR
jgi:hypothetical protein